MIRLFHQPFIKVLGTTQRIPHRNRNYNLLRLTSTDVEFKYYLNYNEFRKIVSSFEVVAI